MNAEEILLFREQFRKIVYAKSEVKCQAMEITKLSVWDKNGSHKEAIIRASNELARRKKVLKELLNGKSYDKWKEFSQNLSKLQRKQRAKTITTVAKASIEIEQLIF